MSETPNTHAVLSGDIIDSTTLGAQALDAIMDMLKIATEQAATWPGMTQARFARREGDGWQIAIEPAGYALRLALLIQAKVIYFARARTRIALSEATGPLPETPDLNAAHGPAFAASGRLLKTLGDMPHMAFSGTGAPAAMTRLADHITQGWTTKQARALAFQLMPDPAPRSATAAILQVSRQAVDQALRGGSYTALTEACALMEKRDNLLA